MKKTKSGFLLIEVLCALALLTTITLVLASYQAQTALCYRATLQRMRATTMAREFLDRYEAHGKAPYFSGEQVDDLTIVWDKRPCFFDMKDVHHSVRSAPAVEKINISLMWHDERGQQQKVSMWTVAKKV